MTRDRARVQSSHRKQVALITDGRFSRGTSGPCVGHACPEATGGGTIALVEDGDLIEIDIPGRRPTLHVDAATLARRPGQGGPRPERGQ